MKLVIMIGRFRVVLCTNFQSRLYSGSHGTIDIWDVAGGKYNLVGKITHSYGSVHALAITDQYIVAGETSLLIIYDYQLNVMFAVESLISVYKFTNMYLSK